MVCETDVMDASVGPLRVKVVPAGSRARPYPDPRARKATSGSAWPRLTSKPRGRFHQLVPGEELRSSRISRASTRADLGLLRPEICLKNAESQRARNVLCMAVLNPQKGRGLRARQTRWGSPIHLHPCTQCIPSGQMKEAVQVARATHLPCFFYGFLKKFQTPPISVRCTDEHKRSPVSATARECHRCTRGCHKS
jgi:hypothetical protein